MSGPLVGLAVSTLVQPLTWSVVVVLEDQRFIVSQLTPSSFLAQVAWFSVVGTLFGAPWGMAAGAVTVALARVRVALWSPST